MVSYSEKENKMNNDIVSVVVLTYKHGALLLETLDSVFLQDHPQIELIVAEDGAKNFDREALEQYVAKHAGANIVSTQILVNEINIGTVKNINCAIARANGAYVKIIAGDDTYPHKSVFSQQVAYLKEHEDTQLVVGNIVECDSEMHPFEVKGFAPDQKENLLDAPRAKLLKELCRKSPHLLATQSLCFKKAFFEQHGVYDERFRLIEDLPMAVRIVTKNHQIGYVDMPCVNHRGSVGVSTSNNAFDARKLAYYTDLKNYFVNCLFPVKKTVGRLFVNMRYRLMCFRIERCKPENQTKKKKILLSLRYMFPIIYYTLTNFGRIKFYFSKGKSKT